MNKPLTGRDKILAEFYEHWAKKMRSGYVSALSRMEKLILAEFLKWMEHTGKLKVESPDAKRLIEP